MLLLVALNAHFPAKLAFDPWAFKARGMHIKAKRNAKETICIVTFFFIFNRILLVCNNRQLIKGKYSIL
jgi:hypothetical protein